MPRMRGTSMALGLLAAALVCVLTERAVGQESASVATGNLAGDRVTRKRLKQRGGDQDTEAAVRRAVEWLADAQQADGSWPSGSLSNHEAGTTGLALLALLGSGHTQNHGTYSPQVRKGLDYLLAQQNSSGLIRAGAGQEEKKKKKEEEDAKARGKFTPRELFPLVSQVKRYHYDHVIASQALFEAYLLTGDPNLEEPAQRAVNYIHAAQNPYLGWRYGVRDGDNDASLTCWMMVALRIAKQCGLGVDTSSARGGEKWIDRMTNPTTGRTGYRVRGGIGTERLRFDVEIGLERPHPTRKGTLRGGNGESMTAMALTARMFWGTPPSKLKSKRPRSVSFFDVLDQKPPYWGTDGDDVDFYYWYWGTLAMSQGGGSPWKKWNTALKGALLPRQETKSDRSGSWPPVGIWGKAGRVYSTAMACLCLESYYRHDMLFRRTQQLR